MKKILLIAFSLLSISAFAKNCGNNPHRIDKVHIPAQLSQYNLFGSTNDVIDVAFIVSPTKIKVTLKNATPYNQGDITLYTYNYAKKPTTESFRLGTKITPAFTQKGNIITIDLASLNLNTNYLIDIKGNQSPVFLDHAIGGILDTYFDASSEQNLGVNLANNVATFKLWSPPAGRITIHFFDQNEQPIKRKVEMKPGKNGVWQAQVTAKSLGVKSLDGLYYQYEVYAYGKSRLALDPYAKSMAAHSPKGTDKIGKAAIVDMKSPRATPANFVRKYTNYDHIANDIDLVCYEVHVRDFTVQPGVVKPELAGTYKGFAEKTDYLKELGITHAQLLPIQNFFTTDEKNRQFSDTDAPVSNYNWGYDPHNYFTPEGWFSSNAADPYARIRELRQLVQDLHNKGIGVIMDVVYNHTYLVETFENVAPGCYYRYNDTNGISAHSGAGPTVESRRKMVQKLTVESLNHFVTEYLVDGFRFDLMGFIDHETMRLIRQEVGKTYNPNNINELVLQGEAWVFSDLDTDAKATGINAATTKLNHPKEYLNLGFFNDVSRDAFAGREHQKGFVQGSYGEIDRCVTAILGGVKNFPMKGKAFATEVLTDDYNAFAENPAVCLNYLTVHDGFTLWDKINLSVNDPSGLKRAKVMKLATAMIFTSQGKVILHAGDEFLRTKPLAINDIEKTRAHKTPYTNPEEGIEYFHENTYISNDYTNQLRWDRFTNEFSHIAVPMVEYYQGLIAMRRALPGLRMFDGDNIRKGITFYGMDIKEGAQTSKPKTLGVTDFSDEKLSKLTLKFTNGPANSTYYIAGEVYDKRTDANTTASTMYAVTFNQAGVGEITFSRDQINNFDLGKWGDSKNLNFKLVKTPGTWESIATAYTGSGNNRLRPMDVDDTSTLTVDLSVVDFATGYVPREVDTFIAYEIDNTLENATAPHISNTNYSRIIVIHNADENAITVDIPTITNPQEWSVIADGNKAGITPIKKEDTAVKIEMKKVTVPALSMAVIVK